MRVLSMLPHVDATAGTGVLAHFDAEVADGIRINRMTLKRNRDGELRVFGPRAGNTAFTFLAPTLAVELTSLANAELERRIADGSDSN